MKRTTMRMKNQLISLIALSLASTFAFADWQLDSDASSLSFVTIKNAAVVESHEFKRLTGNITSGGVALVTIEIDSVETLIPIRNERVRELLFNTKLNPSAFITLNLTADQIKEFQSEQHQSTTVNAKLTLVGQTQAVRLPLSIISIGDSVIVSSSKPVIVSAKQFGLGAGVAALRDIAGLKDITDAVPVSFSLKFDEL